MSFSNQGKINNFSSETPGAKRWPVGTLVRLAVSVSLIGCIIWWMGGVGKIGAIMSRISFRFAMLVLAILHARLGVDDVQMDPSLRMSFRQAVCGLRLQKMYLKTATVEVGSNL